MQSTNIGEYIKEKSRMKRKLIAIAVCAALMVCLLPATALAYTAPDSTVYNDHDYNALKTFLDATSANGTVTNGVMACGSDYSADPATWDGVTWVDVSGEMRVHSISWPDASLKGNLDLSDCTSLQGVDVTAYYGVADNALSNIDVSGCTALTLIYCENNAITSLDLSGLTALTVVSCSNSESLTTLTLTGCSALECIVCDSCPVGTLTFGSSYPNFKQLWANDCGLTSLDFSDNPGMTQIWCVDNDLTFLDVTGLSSLEVLSIGNSPNLGTFDISDLTSLQMLSCWAATCPRWSFPAHRWNMWNARKIISRSWM